MKKLAIVIALVLVAATMAATALAQRPVGAGAGKAFLYEAPDRDQYTCADGAIDLTDGPYGFVVMNTNARGDLIIEVSLKGATPDAAYDIWVNQYPGACPLSSPTSAAALTTNRRGNGNAHLKVPRVEGATNFWISAVGGGLVLRSTAVVLD